MLLARQAWFSLWSQRDGKLMAATMQAPQKSFRRFDSMLILEVLGIFFLEEVLIDLVDFEFFYFIF